MATNPQTFAGDCTGCYLNTEIIKALRVRSSEALNQADTYAGSVDTLLLDAYHPQMQGGTGQTLDWKSLQQFNPSCPWLLAGGLTPDNILDALNQVQPAGIDLSSGVERSPGDKDLTKVAKLFEQLHFSMQTESFSGHKLPHSRLTQN